MFYARELGGQKLAKPGNPQAARRGDCEFDGKHNFGRRHLAKLVKRAGLPRETSLHTLRHTAATLLIGGGTDVRSVQAILGHARASTTLDTYSDAIAKNVETAMAGLDSLVEQTSEA